jgi:hypothetical protein
MKNNTNPYSNIKGIKELRNQRRLLSSRIEHQEVMIFYSIRTIKDNYSPFKIVYMGLEAASKRSPFMGAIFQTIAFIKSLFTR